MIRSQDIIREEDSSEGMHVLISQQVFLNLLTQAVGKEVRAFTDESTMSAFWLTLEK